MSLDPETLLPLTPAVFHILLALSDKERHGYGIMQEIRSNTDGQLRMGPGTLYGTIKRMIGTQLIEESEERPASDVDDERRRYYRITDFGHKVLTTETHRLARLVKVAKIKHILDGGVLNE